MAAATHATSAEYLKPLFKSLRKRVRSSFPLLLLLLWSQLPPGRATPRHATPNQASFLSSQHLVFARRRTDSFTRSLTQELEPDVLMNIAKIAHYMQVREYLKANDAYLQLSIGNAPWPIGVTMVGVSLSRFLFLPSSLPPSFFPPSPSCSSRANHKDFTLCCMTDAFILCASAFDLSLDSRAFR